MKTLYYITFLAILSCSPQPKQVDKELLHSNIKQTDNSNSMYTLNDNEKQLCYNAKLSEEDGLFLKKLTKRPIEILRFDREFSKIEKPDAIGSWTTTPSEENAIKIVLDNLDYFKKQGKYIFISEVGFKIGLTGVTSDPYKLMEYAETNGVNYNIETKDIIEKYKKWDKEFGIIPIGIGFDFCECKIKNTKDIDFKKLANEVYEFCPDAVDQGTETVEALEEEIKRTGIIFLWWD